MPPIAHEETSIAVTLMDDSPVRFRSVWATGAPNAVFLIGRKELLQLTKARL